MMKLIFGCVLMMVGVIGGTGWLIAYSNLVHPGGWVSFFDIFEGIGYGTADKYIILLFYVIAIVGTIISIKAFKDDK